MPQTSCLFRTLLSNKLWRVFYKKDNGEVWPSFQLLKLHCLKCIWNLADKSSARERGTRNGEPRVFGGAVGFGARKEQVSSGKKSEGKWMRAESGSVFELHCWASIAFRRESAFELKRRGPVMWNHRKFVSTSRPAWKVRKCAYSMSKREKWNFFVWSISLYLLSLNVKGTQHLFFSVMSNPQIVSSISSCVVNSR